jgi:hypothetical protein
VLPASARCWIWERRTLTDPNSAVTYRAFSPIMRTTMMIAINAMRENPPIP